MSVLTYDDVEKAKRKQAVAQALQARQVQHIPTTPGSSYTPFAAIADTLSTALSAYAGAKADKAYDTAKAGADANQRQSNLGTIQDLLGRQQIESLDGPSTPMQSISPEARAVNDSFSGLDPQKAQQVLADIMVRNKFPAPVSPSVQAQIDATKAERDAASNEKKSLREPVTGVPGYMRDAQGNFYRDGKPVTADEVNKAALDYQNSLSTNRANASAATRTYGIAGLSPEENDALFGPNGAVTTGRLDPSKINSRTAKIFAQGEILTPGGTNFNRMIADAALQKNATYQQRNMTMQALPDIMQSMVDAGKKVGFSDIRTVGKMQKWAKGELNDPDMTEYMTIRNDALMSIASVMRGVGMSDKAHEAEIEAANPTMSPQALDGWFRGQQKALEPRLKQYNRVNNLGESGKSGEKKTKSGVSYSWEP